VSVAAAVVVEPDPEVVVDAVPTPEPPVLKEPVAEARAG
jgi:hypothetical protein